MSRHADLLQRAKQGVLRPGEIAEVVRDLRDPNHRADKYTLLHIVGRAGATAHRDLVESFLFYQEDPMVARLALKILCDFWGLREDYLDHLVHFVDGVPWDRDEEVRLAAISAAGEYLRSCCRCSLLRRLMGIFRDETEEQTVREAAYFAIARAVGRAWYELPSAARHFDFATQTDPAVLVEAEQRLTSPSDERR